MGRMTVDTMINRKPQPWPSVADWVEVEEMTDTALDRAIRWLDAYLPEGEEVASSKVRADAQAAGVSVTSLYSAREVLGVYTYTSGKTPRGGVLRTWARGRVCDE